MDNKNIIKPACINSPLLTAKVINSKVILQSVFPSHKDYEELLMNGANYNGAILFDEDYNGQVRVLIEDNECIMNSLFVNERQRDLGIGACLVEKAEVYALEKGFDNLYLYVETERWMHDWYKRLGYCDTKETCEVGYTKMVKQLDKHLPERVKMIQEIATATSKTYYETKKLIGDFTLCQNENVSISECFREFEIRNNMIEFPKLRKNRHDRRAEEAKYRRLKNK